ncbi:hypothetical protein EJ02DRAFT_458498 [Clathrospora elynae]|uniref:Mid2 domain-containing protein n=1 Tax=Clathrospora elynae TaxID=706981 RepID=A0A6A5SDY7_9PLEO|nr:hypothetical protein EJ02DRAFT_458498 [Clathrospora elynae]
MLVLAILGSGVNAAVLTAPTPTITAAPLVARDVTTVGYISTGTSGGTTLWDTITVNEQNQVIATSGNLWKICAPGSLCDFFSCKNDYAVYPSSSFYCGGSNETCSSYVLATDVYDHDPLTNYWCDAATETGGIIYQTTPDGTEDISSAFFTTYTPSVKSLSSSSIRSANSAFIPTSTPGHARKKSTPIGAIVGGAIGGIAILGATIFAVFFLLRRKRNRNNAQLQQQQRPDTQYYPQQPPQVQQMSPPQVYDPNAQVSYPQGAYAQPSYPPPEKMPAVANAQVNSYYADSGAVSPVPQYSPSPMNTGGMGGVPANVNELPAQRM